MGHLTRAASGPPAAKSKPPRSLKLEYSGNLIKHLGLQMYAGAVPALAELVSNAWDADASKVTIEIPFGQSITKSHLIRVTDNGRGMSWEDVALEYLVIGRDRRMARGTKTPKGRGLMGRKGVGKLAGFGIANIVEVRTVRNKWLTHFEMDYREMTNPKRSEYIERYEPVVLADKAVNEPNGTSITMRNLQITRAINEDEFRGSMARRFSILSNQFQVVVDGKPIKPTTDDDLAYRTPERGRHVTQVPGFGKIEWWMGITLETIKTPEGRGVAVFAHGKMVQTPFLFNLHGGLHAQHLTQYLTGEVFADRLDEEEDYIATGRQSVSWDLPVPNALEAWGQDAIRSYIKEASVKRERAKDKESLEAIDKVLGGAFNARLQELPELERRQARALVSSLRKIRETDSSKDYAANVADGILSIYEGGIGNWAPVKLLDGDSVVDEYGAFDTARVRSLLRDRLEFLRHLRSLMRDRPRSVDAFVLLQQNPWIVTGGASLPVADSDYEREIRSQWRKRNANLSDKVQIIAGYLSKSRFVIVVEGSNPTTATVERWREPTWLTIAEAPSKIFFVSRRPPDSIQRNGIVLGSMEQFRKRSASALGAIGKALPSSTAESLSR